MATGTLAEVRALMLDLHRELLQHQRLDVERIYGRMTAGDLLQATVSDLRFAWLRPLSELVTEIDALMLQQLTVASSMAFRTSASSGAAIDVTLPHPGRLDVQAP